MRGRLALLLGVSLLTVAPPAATAQGIDLAFRGVDVYSAGVFPTTSDRGAGFGAVIWLGTAFDPRIVWGLGVAFSAADRTDADVTVRNIRTSIDLVVPVADAGRVVPYVGVTGSFHLVETTTSAPANDPERIAAAQRVADEVEGYKIGGGGFGGLLFELTETGSVGLFVEYRLVGAPDVTQQEGRGGIRFSVGGP